MTEKKDSRAPRTSRQWPAWDEIPEAHRRRVVAWMQMQASDLNEPEFGEENTNFMRAFYAAIRRLKTAKNDVKAITAMVEAALRAPQKRR